MMESKEPNPFFWKLLAETIVNNVSSLKGFYCNELALSLLYNSTFSTTFSSVFVCVW